MEQHMARMCSRSGQLVLTCVLAAASVCTGDSAQEQPFGIGEIALPRVVGVVGVGTIGSATVRGLLGSPAGALPFLPDFVLSPRNAEKSRALKAEFPSKVRIAEGDQEVVGAVDCVIVALPAGVAE